MENENAAAEETTQLQEKVTDVTIASPGSENPVIASPGSENPVIASPGSENPVIAVSNGDESGDAQVRIIEQQQSTIDALLARTEQLTKQLNMLVAQGVQITDETPNVQQKPNDQLADDYIPLSDLGSEIGKHDRY